MRQSDCFTLFVTDLNPCSSRHIPGRLAHSLCSEFVNDIPTITSAEPLHPVCRLYTCLEEWAVCINTALYIIKWLITKGCSCVLTRGSHFRYRQSLLIGHEAQNRKDCKPCDKAGATIHQTQNKSVPEEKTKTSNMQQLYDSLVIKKALTKI